jgi:glycosyltransferase involved in cell wall biosynthesis
VDGDAAVSVVVPVRAPAPYLAEALASVTADPGAAEVIVVEDGPGAVGDEPPGTRVVRTPPVGRSRARNLGVEEARTPLVAFLDADDLSLAGRLERQQAALEAAPEAALCFGAVRAVGADSSELFGASASEARRFAALLARGPRYESLLVDCPIYTSATMVRRDAFLAAGGYDPGLDAYEDLDLYLRVARTGRLLPLEGPPVAAHRRHVGNTPSDALYRGSLLVVEKHLPDASGRARRLLLERKLDALWGLGRFAEARTAALAAVRSEPALLGRRRFAYRLAGTLLPLGALASIRRRRT